MGLDVFAAVLPDHFGRRRVQVDGMYFGVVLVGKRAPHQRALAIAGPVAELAQAAGFND